MRRLICHSCSSSPAVHRGCWGDLCAPCWAWCVAWLEKLLGRKHRWSE